MLRKKLTSPQIKIVIDGENFAYQIAKSLKLDRKTMKMLDIRYLCEKTFPQGANLIITYYGTCLVPRAARIMRSHPLLRDNHTKQAARLQQKMRDKFNNVQIQQHALRKALKKQNIKFIAAGVLMPNVREHPLNIFLQEKGVDVRIAVDIVIAPDGELIYLISSDTDLLPAIEFSKARITYVSCHGRLHPSTSHALIRKTDAFIRFKRKHIIEAYRRLNPDAELPE